MQSIPGRCTHLVINVLHFIILGWKTLAFAFLFLDSENGSNYLKERHSLFVAMKIDAAEV